MIRLEQPMRLLERHRPFGKQSLGDVIHEEDLHMVMSGIPFDSPERGVYGVLRTFERLKKVAARVQQQAGDVGARVVDTAQLEQLQKLGLAEELASLTYAARKMGYCRRSAGERRSVHVHLELQLRVAGTRYPGTPTGIRAPGILADTSLVRGTGS